MPDDKYNELLKMLHKEAFVPGGEIGQPPVDPATGMPIDPAMMEQMMGGAGGGGMPPGMPMDPSMMGAPPMDPAMGGMPPGMPPGMPMDPSMMGAPPPGPEAPAEEAPAGSGAPATADDLAVLEERITGLEDMIEDLVDTIDALGGKKSAEAKADAAQAPDPAGAAAAAVPTAVPGPLGGGAGMALSSVRPEASGNVLNNLMSRLSDMRAG